MDETLKILESVNQFYTQAFDQLMNVTLAVIAFAGILMPILIAFSQSRLFRLDNKRIQGVLSEEMKVELHGATEAIRDEYMRKEARYENQIRDLEQEMEKRLFKATGATFHLQTNQFLGCGNNLEALGSACQAVTAYIEAGDEFNLNRVLKTIRDNCLPHLTKEQMEDSPENIVKTCEATFNSLSEFDDSGRYFDQIQDLRWQLKQTMKRKQPKPE